MGKGVQDARGEASWGACAPTQQDWGHHVVPLSQLFSGMLA